MLTPEPRTLSSDKAALRRRMETLRAEAFAQNKNAPLALRDYFLKSVSLPPHCIVASYRAYGSEMDPALLTEALHALGHTIALPVMDGSSKPLVFRTYNPGAQLFPNSLGIEEPGKDAPSVEPDILLVPLLAFDRHGGRLGAGGGYYDRTLNKLRAAKTILAIGIGFACQEVPFVPVDAHDANLDRIATEIRII